MKILILTQHYYPYTSGVPMISKGLAEGLLKKNHSVTVVTTIVPGTKSFESINGVDVFRFGLRYVKLIGIIGEKKEYIKYVLDSRADVVIFEAAQCETTDLLLNHLNKIQGYKIFHSHGLSGTLINFIDFSRGFRHFIGNIYNYLRFKKYYYLFLDKIRQFDKIVYLSSNDSAKNFLDNKINKQNYSVIGNFIDDIFLENSNIDFEKRLKSKVLICVANFTIVKNQLELIHVFFSYHFFKGYTLKLYGSAETDYSNKMQEIIKRYKKKYSDRKVKLVFGSNRREILSALRTSTLYTSTSKFEEFSVSLMEAMSQGLPFVSFNVGNAKFLPGGIVVDNRKDFKEKIEYILSHKDHYCTLSLEAKSYAFNNFKMNDFLRKFEHILRERV